MAQGPGFCPEGEEVKKMENITETKRRKILPRELRIKIYKRVMTLHRRGLSNKEIIDMIEQEYGVKLASSVVSEWTRGRHSPYNGRYVPSIESLRPSKELAYIIGVVPTDGYVSKNESKQRYVITLRAKDKELVKETSRRAAKVLGRKPIKSFRVGKYYEINICSKTLCELLKPFDIEKIRNFVEHCPDCTAAFLRALFDAEGHVSKYGYIYIHNTNYELLEYAKKLLRRFGIETTGPWPTSKNRRYPNSKNCYYLYIKASSNINFYRHIGFTIKRKQKRLEEYLKRTGKL